MVVTLPFFKALGSLCPKQVAVRLQLGLLALLGPVVPGGMSPAVGPSVHVVGTVDQQIEQPAAASTIHQMGEAAGPLGDSPVDGISNPHCSSNLSRSQE